MGIIQAGGADNRPTNTEKVGRTMGIWPIAAWTAAGTITVPSYRRHQALACCQRPSPVGLPRPRWVEACLELAAIAAGAPPLQGGCASVDVAVPSSPPDLGNASPSRAAAEICATAREEAATARGRGPPPPLPPGLRPTGLRATARRGGRGRLERWRRDLPPCHLGLRDTGADGVCYLQFFRST
jgi:hypothetical protein